MAWILEYLFRAKAEGRPFCVDVLDADFIWAYIEETGARAVDMSIGAPRCDMVAHDLLTLYRAGRLTRVSVGLGGDARIAGMPRWVYSYELSEQSKDILKGNDGKWITK